MKNDPIIFEMKIAKNKPQSYRHQQVNQQKICPFCDVAHLNNIYQKKGEMIWVRNKFPTLRDTTQTVLIESSNHYGDISNYSQKKNQEIIKFALTCFEKMRSTKKYFSVLWYKNYGPHSGGSLVHPHMQIVGLKKKTVINIFNLIILKEKYYLKIKIYKLILHNIRCRDIQS